MYFVVWTICFFVVAQTCKSMSPYQNTPFKKVTQHDFNRLYQFVYGFVFIMLGINLKAWLFVFPMIYTSFVMIALQKRAQGDQIGFNVNMFKNWTTNLIDDTNLFMRLYSSCYAMSKNKCSMENWGAARYSEGSLFRRFVN